MTLFKIITTAIIMTVIKTTIMILISTTVFKNINEQLEKMIYFVFTILGMLLPPKVLYATHG